MRDVLLINSGKREPLRLLANDPAVRLTVLTTPRYRHLYRNPIVVDDIADLKAVTGALLGRQIDAIVAATERSQLTAAYLRAVFCVPGMAFDVANLFTHKYAMKQRLAAEGIPVTPHRLLPADLAGLNWPIVLKPVYGAGSLGTRIVRSHQELLAAVAYDRNCPLIAEQFVDMEAEYHCDGIVHRGEVVFALPSKYFAPLLGALDAVSGSHTVPLSAPDHEELAGLHRRVVDALALRDGVTHLEAYKLRSGQFVVGEIACRPGGAGIAEYVKLHTGVDLWAEFIRLSLGQAPSPVVRLHEGIFANVQLPAAQGRVVHLSPIERLTAIPGVVHARYTVSVDDVLTDDLHSSAYAGVVFLHVNDLGTLTERLGEVSARHVLRVVANH